MDTVVPNYTGVIHPQACPHGLWTGLRPSVAAPIGRSRSSTSTSTPSTRCSTVRRGSTTSSPRPRPTGSPRSASPTTATCTASSTSTAPRARPTSRRSSAPRRTCVTDRPRHDRPRRDRARASTTSRCSRSRTQGYQQPHQGVVGTRTSTASSRSPRVDFELLEQHHEGLDRAPPAASAARCRQALLDGRLRRRARARRRASRTIFGRDNFFIELQDHGLPEQHAGQPAAGRASRASMRAPLLATNDSHYTHRHDAEAHDALLCVQTGATHRRPEALQVRRRRVLPEDRGGDARPLPRLRGGVRQHAAGSPSAPTSRSSSATRCCRRSPRPRATTRTRTCASSRIEGAKERYGASPGPEVLERIEFELGVIKTMGFSAYFLVVWDLVRVRARRAASGSGPGRGSAAGSCVAYCLRIVDIDPIKYDLLFERFLNPGRKQMPDIDMDFDSRYRGEMIKYAAERYGVRPRRADRHVLHHQGAGRGARRRARARLPVRRRRQDRQAHAAAHHGPRHAAARVPREGTEVTRTATRWPPSCATLYEADPDAKRVIDVARGLEGLRRQDGIHAAAVVITREPLTEYLPIQRKPEPGGDDRGRADRHPVRDARRRGPRPAQDGLPRPAQPRRHRDHARPRRASAPASRPDIDHVPLDDAEDVRAAARGRHHRRVPARRRADARAAALARAHRRSRTSPRSSRCTARARWPRTWHNDYADRKNGRKPVTYYHPDLEEVLAPTYGLMIYQEQLMRVAQRLAGYSLEEADNLRKATGKKNRELIAKERSKFVDGCVAQGHDRAVRRADVRHHRAVRRLLVQQVALGRLRLRRVPDRVPEGELPGRVPRRAAHERQDEQGPDRGLPQRVPAAGHRRCSSPTSTSPTPTSRCAHRRADGRRERDPVRAVRGPQRRRGRRRAHRRGARGRRPVHRLLRLLRAGRPVGAEQAHDRVADQGRRVRLARPPAPGPRASCYEPIVDAVLDRRRNEAEDHSTSSATSTSGDADVGRRPTAPRSPTPSSRRRSGSRSRRRCSGST